SPNYSNSFIYTWEASVPFVAQDSSIVIDSATSADNVIYTLVITNGSCRSDSALFLLNVSDSPAVPVISGENVYCYGDSVFLMIENPIDGAMYSWTSSDTNVVINSPGTLIIPDATPSWTGVYTVDVTLDGCTSGSSMIAIQVKAPLFAPSILSPALVCEGDSLTLIANGPPGATFQWISSNGFESTEDRPVIYPVGPQDAGTYQVLYILNGCPSPPSNPFEISVQPALNAPSITADITAVCIDNPVPVQLCVDQASWVIGGTYTWLLNGTTVIGAPGSDSCITIDGGSLQGGVNEVSAIVSLQGCPSDAGNTVLITGDEIPAQGANAGPDIIVCPGDVVFLDATIPSQGTGMWSSGNDLVIFSDATDPQADVIGLPSGMYGLAWTLSYASCIDYSTDSVAVSILFSPEAFPDTIDVPFGQTVEFSVTPNDIIPGGSSTITIWTSPQKGNVLHVGNGVFRYAPNVGFVGTDMMAYRICSTECPDECSIATVVLKVGNEDDCFVPSLFTPNQDGVNDILIVPCLETDRYPDNKIIIFNEWGAAVYTASPYQNDWDGSISGSPLPVGTYFYIMDFGDGSTPKRSFLVLER
ncbi:MAG TPA: gliding motility-associated C-terminal domain-containing protein, partial [Saprospiraceae bacterium]|nr:gliding motility-associated C-terminal domain-containing protein [Saprospiraceae bacterium]